MTTYDRGDPAINNSENYDELFEKRGVTSITQYSTKVFSTSFKDKTISYYQHYWSHGDRYHKLASKYYNDYRFWWVIAIFNETPSEGTIRYGDLIKIPVDYKDIIYDV